jgi:GNAT superfamily N-acetyltransferase
VKTIPSCKLKSGETLSIEYFEPGPQVPASLAEEITRFVIQVETLDSWPSVAESLYLKRCLQGRFAETGLDPLFLGRLDGRIAGDVGCQVSRDSPEVGSLGWVFTDPAQRGKGISSHLTRLAVQWFQDRGGVCMLLGTGNPIAHHVYGKYGFRDYNGHVMRRLSPGAEAEDFEQRLFARTGPAAVRPAVWSDASRVAALYAAPHPWLVQDYQEGLIIHPSLKKLRYFSIFPALMLRAERPGGSVQVLETSRERIVGLAALLPEPAPFQAHVGRLDFLIRPEYLDQGHELLTAVLNQAREGGVQTVEARFASCDDAKLKLAREAGFRRTARFPDRFRIGAESVDLELYVSTGV